MKKMKQNIILRTLTLVLSVILAMTLINAVADFSTTPTSFSLTTATSSSGQGVVNITNTGDENLNLTVSKVDLTSGSNTITLVLSQTSIVQLVPGESETVTFTYVTSTTTGTFTGSVSVTDGTQTDISVISVNVATATVNEPSLVFEGEGNTLEIIGELGDTEKESFTLLNNGNETLTDIQFDLEDLDGNDDTIDVKYIEIEGDDVDDFEINELEIGETDRLRFEVDIDDDIDVDDYRGDLEIRAERPNGETVRFNFVLKVVTESNDEDVYIKENSGDVRQKELVIYAEPGETIDDLEIIVGNDAGGDVNDLILVLDGDFEEEDSANTIEKETVSFNEVPFDVPGNDDETVEFEITVPEDQATGDYLADLELRSATDKKLDEILVRVKVTGDIFISNIEYDETANPGDDLDVKVTVRNQGSKVYRNVKVSATLFDVEYGGGDIIESSSSFILNSGEEKTNTLQFALPDDAIDGEATLEIRVNYEDEELYELESVNVERPTNNMVVDSYAINPRVAKCEEQVFTYIKYRNLGKFDRDVKVSAEIVGTNVKVESSTFELSVDEVDQQNLVLDISILDAGDYTVLQKIEYGSGLFVKRESNLKIVECTDASTGIIIKPINETQLNISDNESSEGYNLFGSEVDKSTVYLGVGLGFVVLLIVIGLFLI